VKDILGKVWPVVLSGGSGARLWPLSRTMYPKQLLALTEQLTMIQATAARVTETFGFQPMLVIAGEDHRFLIADQLVAQGQSPAAILLEPEGRNTAPAVALAALWAIAQDPEAVILVIPSDHVIRDVPAFHAAIATALGAAQAGALVTFGIAPDGPETGYGYIRRGAAVGDGIHAVARFVEKPDMATAIRLSTDGEHSWNAGIFLLHARTYLNELNRVSPDIATAMQQAFNTLSSDQSFIRPGKQAFLSSPSISIDYAVMEKTDKALVVPVSMGWSDVGSWDALWAISPQDSAGNGIAGDVVQLDTHNSLLRSVGGPMIATVGLDNMMVIATRDAVLVAPRDRAQDVKAIVDQLKASARTEYKSHTVVHRPWGTYETVDEDDGFQTKRIVVKPGQQLSLQLHHQRSEHWVVVRGVATVTVGDKVEILHPNQSTYIPVNTKHRLENHGTEPLYLIEVQCGAYLGEDDIVRFDDIYGRSGTVG
jgi:mannose-1-phosphate guanylyltransferase / mannose-6-phosphate isomerase